MPDDTTKNAAPEPAPLSLVAACDARDCRYNHAAACTAGAVTVAFVGGQARCATYSPAPPPPSSDAK